ncbi:hypothetical protein N7462_005571 [Penicillium macrosclerotiorum]|uniref:uncharacterized protein n=1 Tax=Penicillium macrosclerotiorum TaxID=303699 RepID=UPI002547E405|nr:uncharacterized protein N7462_005571 [Penicillium macrosclerotiorum]KAJ5682406.1 hypothetical protein N7462_005571 [Penicillium macrosclerotiorum]
MIAPGLLLSLMPYVRLGHGLTLTGDPSLTMDLTADAADNALVADWDISVVSSLQQALEATVEYSGSSKSTSVDDETLSATANDTSVIIITAGADVNLTDDTIVKHGYSSNLWEASFWGMNAAVNVQNTSISYITDINVTTHNGAANIYAYGSDTVVYVDGAWLYSSGPVAHGLYASGDGTIIATDVRHYSGGNRCSSFAGDSPAGYVTVEDSVAHTAGIGSAIFYALGEITATNVTGWAENSPILFMDGDQTATISDSTLYAGLLAGFVIFSSSERYSGASLSISSSTIELLNEDIPALWFGNVIADATLDDVTITTESGILVVANYSQVTQDFDYYAGYDDNSALSPAEAYITVSDSTLTGDLVAYNESLISWSLTDSSSWTGTAYSGYDTYYIGVSLDSTSTWTLTADTCVYNFTDTDTSVTNVKSAGYTLTYDKSSSANSWLDEKTISLSGGGSLVPGTCN